MNPKELHFRRDFIKKFGLAAFIAIFWKTSFGSRSFVNASSQCLTVAISSTNVPVSVAFWMKPTSLVTNMMAICFNAGATRSFYVNISGTSKVQAVTDDGPAAVSTASVSTGAWQHVVAVWASTIDRRIYLNGAKDTDTTSRVATSATRMGIGAQSADGVTTSLVPFDGLIAEVSVHGGLTDAQAAELYAGCPPRMIQPFYSYYPLAGSPLNNTVQSLTLTNINSSAANTDHPRTYR